MAIADVRFINLTAKLNPEWGITRPVQVKIE